MQIVPVTFYKHKRLVLFIAITRELHRDNSQFCSQIRTNAEKGNELAVLKSLPIHSRTDLSA